MGTVYKHMIKVYSDFLFIRKGIRPQATLVVATLLNICSYSTQVQVMNYISLSVLLSEKQKQKCCILKIFSQSLSIIYALKISTDEQFRSYEIFFLPIHFHHCFTFFPVSSLIPFPLMTLHGFLLPANGQYLLSSQSCCSGLLGGSLCFVLFVCFFPPPNSLHSAVLQSDAKDSVDYIAEFLLLLSSTFTASRILLATPPPSK